MIKRWVGGVAGVAILVSACGASGTGDETAGGISDGIQIEGHWSIDIVNPDGTLDRTVEFQNEITTPGAQRLAYVLSLEEQLREWDITVEGGTTICGVFNSFCAFDATPSYDDTTGELVLNGSIVAENDGDIDLVTGNFLNCVVDDVGDCSTPLSVVVFSTHALSPEAVAAGQTVLIEVRYSFA